MAQVSPLNAQTSNDDRSKWDIGSQVHVYSDSQKKWFIGKVSKITTDTLGEWLHIEYGQGINKTIKQIQRLSEYIQTIPSLVDDDIDQKNIYDIDDNTLNEFISVMNHTYGEYKSDNWKPKGYKKGQPRYLWTDAFGVINYLTLYSYTNNLQYLNQALILVNEVHNILGKTRDGKHRLGNSTDNHPLLNGLRIGKINAESSDMDGDGQYFHYLTKWLFALNRLSLITGNYKYNKWAIEMATNVFTKFVDSSSMTHPRMYWKLNIQLNKILVNSEGNLDPLDGYVTYKLLQDADPDDNCNILQNEIKIFQKMVDRKIGYYNSNDTLDLGEACWISHWYLNCEDWANKIAIKSLINLNKLNDCGEFKSSSYYRLAFREFGTTLGTKCLYYNSNKLKIINDLAKPWNDKIVPNLLKFWKKNNAIYQRDNDITPQMYCSSLIPGVWCKTWKFIKK